MIKTEAAIFFIIGILVCFSLLIQKQLTEGDSPYYPECTINKSEQCLYIIQGCERFGRNCKKIEITEEMRETGKYNKKK